MMPEDKYKPSLAARKIAATISRVLNALKKESLAGVFNNRADFGRTLKESIRVDTAYGALTEKNGFLSARHHSDSEVAQIFSNICVKQWDENNRPSLPALILKQIENLGINVRTLTLNPPENTGEDAVAKASMLVAARAEMVKGAVPIAGQENSNAYHNTLHTTHVTLIAGYLAEKNNLLADEEKTPSLSRKDQMILSLAALAHDIDHGGAGNPKDNPYQNEEESFSLVKPLMEAAGMEATDIDKVHIMLLTTSPDGPHAYLKAVASAHREGRIPTKEELDPEGRFPELEPLCADKNLKKMAAILSDSDLFASAGAGLIANEEMSDRLSHETGMDLRSDQARKFFLDEIVGKEGFCSDAGRESFNSNFESLRRKTEDRIKNDLSAAHP